MITNPQIKHFQGRTGEALDAYKAGQYDTARVDLNRLVKEIEQEQIIRSGRSHCTAPDELDELLSIVAFYRLKAQVARTSPLITLYAGHGRISWCFYRELEAYEPAESSLLERAYRIMVFGRMMNTRDDVKFPPAAALGELG